MNSNFLCGYMLQITHGTRWCVLGILWFFENGYGDEYEIWRQQMPLLIQLIDILVTPNLEI